jgi:hypothetical protein
MRSQRHSQYFGDKYFDIPNGVLPDSNGRVHNGFDQNGEHPQTVSGKGISKQAIAFFGGVRVKR